MHVPGNSSNGELRGVFPVIPTLFDDNDDVDVAQLHNVLHWTLEAGAHGVVFPGVASEYNYLSDTERGKLTQFVASEVNGKVPIIGGASAATVNGVVTAGRQAMENGIDYLMIMAPKELGSETATQSRFFDEIATELPNAKIILQNAPSPVGAGLSATTLSQVAAATQSVAYIKEETLPSGPAITALLESEIPHLRGVFGGGGARYIIDELDRGAQAALPAAELTDLHVALYQAYQDGNHKRARELYRLSLPLLVSQAIYRMRLTKYVLSKRGIAHALHVRAPLPEIDPYTQRDIDRMLSDLQAQFP